MSYVVFARKYRPMGFADMIGQEHIGRTLGNAIAQDRVHHAYLFAGARGLGKTTTARIFAKGLVCENGPTAEPCNACTQCVAVTEGSSVDVIEIDGASNNSVDNIRSLREQVNYLPQSARRKVYIIDEVHMLTTSAFNALLKTLEEPPAHVNFVFATTEPQKLLATILSRVNRLDFRRVSVEQLKAHLASILEREGFSVEDGGLRLAARAAGGSVRDALTLLDQVVAFAADPHHVTEEEARRLLGQADRFAVAELVDAILDRDPSLAMQRFEALMVAGHDLSVLAIQTLEHLRDLAMVRACGTADVLSDATETEYQQLQAQSAKTDAATLGQLFDRFSRVLDRLQTSRTPRLLVEMGLLDLASVEPIVPLGDLVERLNALSSGAPGAGPSPGRGPGGGPSAPTRGRRADAPPGDLARRHVAPATPSERSAAPVTPSPAAAPGPTPEPAPAELAVAPPPTTLQAAPTAAPTPATPAEPPAFASDLARQLYDQALSAGAILNAGSAAAQVPARRPPSTPAAAPPSAEPTPHPDPLPPAPAPQMGAGPCAPSPPADGVIAWAELQPFTAWEMLLSRVRDDDDFLAAVLGEVGLVALAEGALRIAAPRRSFAHTELSKHPQMRAQLEQALRDHFGAPFAVELIEAEPSLPELPSLVLVAARRRQRHRAEVEAEAQSDPRICALLRQFDAELKGTRPLHEP
jgi:DNA polymerase-3 subunit gamma/tau